MVAQFTFDVSASCVTRALGKVPHVHVTWAHFAVRGCFAAVRSWFSSFSSSGLL